MRDAHGRTIITFVVGIDYNLCCTYCMAEDMQFLPRRDLLTFEINAAHLTAGCWIWSTAASHGCEHVDLLGIAAPMRTPRS